MVEHLPFDPEFTAIMEGEAEPALESGPCFFCGREVEVRSPVELSLQQGGRLVVRYACHPACARAAAHPSLPPPDLSE